jgi:uncharacterized NAD(P)/FAD-binding protein YdhS
VAGAGGTADTLVAVRSTPPVRVLIVGGGASGVLTAARIMDATSARPAHVLLVEPNPRLAAGVAYSTEDPEHLLNVRASGMSADPSDPTELVRWIAERGQDDPDTFVPRRDYREYLVDHLERAVAAAPDGTLEVRDDRVTGIALTDDGGCRVELASGTTELVDHVVLAIGNPPPAVPPPLDQLAGHPAWVPDPWAPGALERCRDAHDIVLVGTGLTMVDVAITLGRECPPPARMVAFSRNGLLPTAHVARQPHRPISVIDLERDSVDVCALADRVRARTVDGEGTEYPDEDWREVIDAIRPYANALWRRYDREQQARFLQLVLRQWDIHRHRMSPPTAARLRTLLDSGRLGLHAGSVERVHVVDDRTVRLGVDLDGEPVELVADAVVNCTGPGRPWAPPANPVISDLFERGLARPDPHGLGLETTAAGCLVDAAGDEVRQIMVIGPPRRGTLFETTAVPELRSQALHIADHVIIGDTATLG